MQGMSRPVVLPETAGPSRNVVFSATALTSAAGKPVRRRGRRCY